MKKMILTVSAAILSLAGCTTDMDSSRGVCNNEEGLKFAPPETISAGFDAPETKMTMADSGSFIRYYWKEGDQIAYVSPSKSPVIYTLSKGAGTRSAEFTLTSGTFVQYGYYTVCHYGKNVTLDGNSFKVGSGEVFVSQKESALEDQAVYINEIFDEDSAPLEYFVAMDVASIPTSINFKPAFSILKIDVKNTRSEAVLPQSLVLTASMSGDDYFVSGLEVTSTDDTPSGAMVGPSGTTNELTVDLSDQGAIDAGATASYLVLCRQNPSRGTLLKLDFKVNYQ